MKTLKVLVRDEFYEEIREEAHSRRISIAEVAREYFASNHAVASMKPPNQPLPYRGQIITNQSLADAQPAKPKTMRDVIKERLG